jgi:hypothetical protein
MNVGEDGTNFRNKSKNQQLQKCNLKEKIQCLEKRRFLYKIDKFRRTFKQRSDNRKNN